MEPFHQLIIMRGQRSIQKSFYGKAVRGFSLIELVVVLVIMVILLALTAPSLSQAISANRLTSAGEGLLFKVSLAQQIAVTENRPVEIRFYRYTAEDLEGFHAYQLFFLNESENEGAPVENPVLFGEGTVSISETALSPLLDIMNSGGLVAAQTEPFSSRNARYKSIVFYPNGTTNIHAPLRRSYLTLADPRAAVEGAGGTPPNFYTLQIDPVTGRARSYRP
jgi:uncharacterized protein (TIGR02596 family)